jgi:pimeloyl-ACP methyl ester carboxylesterase
MQHIVFLHGLSCTGQLYKYIIGELPKHKAYVPTYNSYSRVETILDNIVEQLPKEPFWIVGHSLGGVIAHLIISRGLAESRVKGLITVASPFGGSRSATTLRWFFRKMPILNDLTPKSKIIKEVTEERLAVPFMSIISTHGHLPFIAGENDGVVSIDSQRNSPAPHKIEIAANHGEVLLHDETIGLIREFIFERQHGFTDQTTFSGNGVHT